MGDGVRPVLDPAFRKGFAHLNPLDLSFESCQLHPQLDDTADLLKAFPDTNVILNHWALKRITAKYSQTEKLKMHRDTAARVYRLEV